MDKQKINYLLILLFCMFFLNSCKKYSNEYTEVEFVIVNPANDKPFEGIPVQISLSKATNKGVKDGEEFHNGVTDANGRAAFKFKARKGVNYWYTPSADFSSLGSPNNYEFFIRPIPGAYTIKKNQYNEMRYEITYYAYLREKIKNVNCEGASDTLKWEGKYIELNYGSKAYDNHTTVTGCYEYETTSIDGNPEGYMKVFMGTHVYNYEVVRPSGVDFGADTLHLGKGEFGRLQLDSN